MDPVTAATKLRREAVDVDQRRLLVLTGDREVAYDHLESILEALAVPITGTTLVGPDDRLRCVQVRQANADRLLGTTQNLVVLDCHEECRPNALGSVVGTVDGGGLLVLVTPPLDEWPDRRDRFDESLAAPPETVEAVTGHFRRRLVETVRAHAGIAVFDVDSGSLVQDGLIDPAPRLEVSDAPTDPTGESQFPAAAYRACLTSDQRRAVRSFERFAENGTASAVIVEANRGRGKSSAAGLAAGSLAATGRDIAITAPQYENAAEIFARAGELLDALDERSNSDGSDDPDESGGCGPRLLTPAGGCVRFESSTAIDDWIDSADLVIVDEAAALPVSTLEATLAADRVAYATTVHGYEGTGRGFSVRFRERLDASHHAVESVSLVAPIRYAAGDPIETWAFRALLLDARPPVEEVIDRATPESVTYHQPDAADLLADDHRLREAFGLLVLAHYRTEPTDLARLLDAPNLSVHTLEYDGHVVCVALLAREGGLDEKTRAAIYEGDRIRGNMIPDVLTSQLRDEAAGEPTGYRVVRIATHHAVRSRGLASHLLERIHETAGLDADWFGSGFGATPGLLQFWQDNGYETVHASTTRNDRSGEYSAIVLAPTSEAGRRLRDRHAAWFAERTPAVFSDALDDLDPDVARALLRSVPGDAAPELDLSDHDWQVVTGAAYGPGLFDIDPGPFRRLVVRYLTENPSDVDLDARAERLLVRRGLQGAPWSAVADELDFHSPGQCMRAMGEALQPLVDRYGSETAHRLRERFRSAE